MMRGSLLIGLALLLAGCDAAQDAAAPVVPVPVPGGEVSEPYEVRRAAYERMIAPHRVTVDGATYLVEFRQVRAPRVPRPADLPDDVIDVEPAIWDMAHDIAVSRQATPFTQADRAAAERVAIADCSRLSSLIPASARGNPRFVAIDRPGDSNEWVFPSWCSLGLSDAVK